MPRPGRSSSVICAKAFASPTLFLKQSAMRGSTLELRIGHEMLGTIDQVDDEGERSWAVTVMVLEEDLGA